MNCVSVAIVRMIKETNLLKVSDEHIKEGYEYYTATMKNTALKKFTMKLSVLWKTFQLYAKVENWHGRNTAYSFITTNIFITTIYAPTILLISAFCHVKILSFSIK